jgi:hypothetical protein
MKQFKNTRVSAPSLLYWLMIGIISSVVVFLRAYFAAKNLDLGNFVVSAVSAILVALLIMGLIKFKNNVVT